MVLTSLQQYLHYIWRDTPGVVHLASKGSELHDWHATLFSWPKDETKIVQYIQRRTPSHEVFVNPVLYKDNGIRDKSVLSRDNVLGSWTLWADFDGTARSHWRHDTDIPEPTFRVVTSTESHQHCYWQLSEFLTDPTVLESKNRTIAYRLDADKSGWDYSQLLRPPDTTNHGYGKNRTKSYDVRFEETSDRAYSPNLFIESDDYKPVVSFFPGQEKLPTITRVLAEHSFSKQFIHLLHTDKIPDDRSGAMFKLGCLAAENGLNDPEIYTILNYIDSVWGKYVGRRDHDRRLVEMLNSVRKRIPFGMADVKFGDIFNDAQIEDAPQSVYTFQEFMALDIRFEWLYKGLLPKGGYMIFYGSPGVGKTLLGMDFVNAVVSGSDWMDWTCEDGPKKVLFLSLEMNIPLLKEQYERMSKKFPQEKVWDLNERLRLYPLAETLPLDRPEGRDLLSKLIQENGPDIVLIDSLSELSEKSLQDDEPARNLNRFLRYLRNRYGVSICIIHHNKKSSQRNNHTDLDDMWGSRFLGAGADSILFFADSGLPDSPVLCIHDKSRMSARGDTFLIERDWETFTFTRSEKLSELNKDDLSAKGINGALRTIAIGTGSRNPLDKGN